MKLTQEQKTRLINVAVSALVAVLAIFGYHVTINQPQDRNVASAVADRYFDAVTIGKQFRSQGSSALDGGITVDTTNFVVNGSTGAISAAGDLTLAPDATGGNAGAQTEFSGLPRLKFVGLSTMTNGATETTSYTDDSSAGEYAPIDADVTEAEGSIDGIYRIGSSSYKALFAATAAAGDGFKRTVISDALASNESVGMWLYPSVAVAAGDLNLLLTDNGGARTFTNTLALPASKWTWLEFDISSLDGTTGDVITEVGVTLTTQGATNLAAFNLYMDGAWKWDAADEEALGVAILPGGVRNVLAVATAAGSVNTAAVLTENTDYFVHYESENDFIVAVTDQSANSGLAVVAY